VPEAVCEALRRSISRNVDDEPRVFHDERSSFVTLDIGAFTGPAVVIDEHGALTLVTGEPLLGDGGTCQSRQADAETIRTAFRRGDLKVLAQANGVFNAVCYDAAAGVLCFAADKLGLRPLYYYVADEFVIFASAVRVLEEIDEVPKVMDIRAVTEMAGLGYALADRTPYIGIRLLRAGEILKITDATVTSEGYWRWDWIEQSNRPEEELLTELYGRFDLAVARRVGNDSSTAAYLSGGLDSRCIVAALRKRGVGVHTFNFARPNTQDQIFGREFAAAVGAIHTEIPKQPGDLVPDYSSLMAEVWAAVNKETASPAERPNIVWSGEGGSVALGHVHLTEKMVELMRVGEIDAVIDEYLARESARVSPRLFSKEIAAKMSRLIDR
jgi:asparagine synthase (glutamine-hydrolysing)